MTKTNIWNIISCTILVFLLSMIYYINVKMLNYDDNDNWTMVRQLLNYDSILISVAVQLRRNAIATWKFVQRIHTWGYGQILIWVPGFRLWYRTNNDLDWSSQKCGSWIWKHGRLITQGRLCHRQRNAHGNSSRENGPKVCPIWIFVLLIFIVFIGSYCFINKYL